MQQTSCFYEIIHPSDLPGIARLFVEVFNGRPWNETWSYDSAFFRLTNITATPGFMGIKAIKDRSIVAFVIGYCEPFDEGTDFFVKEMCVAPPLQRQGIGTELLNDLKKRLISAGMRRVYLLASSGGPAVKFYERNGLRVIKRMIVMGQRLGTGRTSR